MDNIELSQPHLSYRQKPLLLKFIGNRFVDVSSVSGEIFQQPQAGRGAAFGDLDNDGDTDVVIANCNGPALFIRNEGGNRNHWIGIKLRGTRSNRDGIGAKITLTRLDGKSKYNHVTTTAGYLSAHDARVFFGLGKDVLIKQIRIEWPSGIVQEIFNPKIDQFLHVEENEGKRAAQITSRPISFS